MSNDTIVISRTTTDQPSSHSYRMAESSSIAYEPVPAAGLHPELVRRLLDNLERNEEFRALFEASPEEALRSIGYQDPWICMQGSDKNRLASAERFREQRPKLESVLTSSMRMDIFRL